MNGAYIVYFNICEYREFSWVAFVVVTTLYTVGGTIFLTSTLIISYSLSMGSL